MSAVHSFIQGRSEEHLIQPRSSTEVELKSKARGRQAITANGTLYTTATCCVCYNLRSSKRISRFEVLMKVEVRSVYTEFPIPCPEDILCEITGCLKSVVFIVHRPYTRRSHQLPPVWGSLKLAPTIIC